MSSATCAPHSPAIAISASATASPPSEQSCTPSTTRSTDQSHGPDRAARPRRRDRPRAGCPRAGRGAWPTRSRRAPPRCEPSRMMREPSCRAGGRRHRVELVDHADDDRPRAWGRCRGRATRCRSSRFRRRRGCQRLGRPRSCRRSTSENCHITSGCSGLPKFRQFTSARGIAAHAGQVARRLHHREAGAHPRVERAEPGLAVGGEREGTAACPSAGAPTASPPGATTVLRNSWWSYWRYTHDLSAMVGRGEQREQLAGEVGAVGEARRQHRRRGRRPAGRRGRRAARQRAVGTPDRRRGSRPGRRRSARGRTTARAERRPGARRGSCRARRPRRTARRRPGSARCR